MTSVLERYRSTVGKDVDPFDFQDEAFENFHRFWRQAETTYSELQVDHPTVLTDAAIEDVLCAVADDYPSLTTDAFSASKLKDAMTEVAGRMALESIPAIGMH
jgi:hypothetical protein